MREEATPWSSAAFAAAAGITAAAGVWRGIEGGEVSVERRGRVKESREVASRRHAADKGGL